MLVYRVELETDLSGPYSGSRSYYFPESLYWKLRSSRHPGPFEDFSNSDKVNKFLENKAIFGFESLHDLKEWFHGMRATLHKQGYVIGIYAIDNRYVFKGRHQVMFRKEMTTRISQRSLARLCV